MQENIQAFTNTFSNVGTIVAQLKVYDATGLLDTESKNVVVALTANQINPAKVQVTENSRKVLPEITVKYLKVEGAKGKKIKVN